MSNLYDKNSVDPKISHNMAMHSGPNLNQKLTTSLMLLRFDKNLLCFDLKKAFCQISLPESDQSKLLFLWPKNIDPKTGTYEIKCYKNARLPFGLRCSPTILMVGLYQILVNSTDQDDPDLKVLKSF